MRRTTSIAALAAVTLFAGACASPGTSKSGDQQPITFTVGYAGSTSNVNGQTYAGPAFLAALRQGFGSSLTIQERKAYGDFDAHAQAALLRAIASGEIDAGWVPAVDFADARISGFDPLVAPMVITSYDAQSELVTSPVAQKALDRLKGTGLVGLTLAVGGLRHPASTVPVVGLADWRGRTLAGSEPVLDRTAAALGAATAEVSGGLTARIADGSIDTIDVDVPSYDVGLLAPFAPYLTSNVVLWPRVWVLVMNEKRFAALSDREQALVRSAADAARRASVDGQHREAAAAQVQCDAGARFPEATPAQVAGLRSAVRPVLDAIASDPQDAALLTEVQAIAARHPDVETLDLPQYCRTSPVRVPRDVTLPVPTSRSPIPAGTYRMSLLLSDLLASGVEEGRARDNDVVITLLVKPDGTYEQFGQDIAEAGEAARPNLAWEAGDVRGSGSTVYFVPSTARLDALRAAGVPAAGGPGGNGDNLQSTPYSVTWKVTGNGSLVFSDIAGLKDPIGQLWMINAPYQRIG